MCGGGHKKINSIAGRKHKRLVRGGGGESANALTWRINNEVSGPWIFHYYHFVSMFGRDPIDLLDFFDGLDSLSILLELQGPRL